MIFLLLLLSPLLCCVIGKSTFYFSRINASVPGENWQLKNKKQKKTLKAWDFDHFAVFQLGFMRRWWASVVLNVVETINRMFLPLPRRQAASVLTDHSGHL